MNRFNWFSSSSSTASTKDISPLKEQHLLEDALVAANWIMNDEVDRAEEKLSKDDSAFHMVCNILTCTTSITRNYVYSQKTRGIFLAMALETCSQAPLLKAG